VTTPCKRQSKTSISTRSRLILKSGYVH